jgi:hypothetical protein
MPNPADRFQAGVCVSSINLLLVKVCHRDKLKVRRQGTTSAHHEAIESIWTCFLYVYSRGDQQVTI